MAKKTLPPIAQNLVPQGGRPRPQHVTPTPSKLLQKDARWQRFQHYVWDKRRG